MPECTECSGVVSSEFARVFGDDNDDVHACPDWMTFREIQNGAAAETPPDPEIDDSVSMLYRDRD